MDSFDKKISDLYNDDQSNDLPEGFGWDAMHEGIYEKMEEPKRKKRFFWVWFTVGSSMVLLFSVFFFSKKIETKEAASIINIAETTENKNPIHSDKTTIKKPLAFTENTQEDLSNILKPNTSSIRQTSEKTVSNFNLEKNKIEEALDAFSSKKLEFTNTNATLETTKSGGRTTTLLKTESKIKEMDQSTNLDESIPVTKTLAYIPINTFLIPNKLRLTPPIFFVPKEPKQSIDIEEEEKEDAIENKEKIKTFSSIHLFGGALFTSGDYDQNQERNTYSKWLPGYYTGIEFTVLEYKKWKLNLGYEHKFAVQLFDFQNVVDTISNVMIEDVLTQTSTQSLSGVIEHHFEDITTEGVRTRSLVHYNTFRSHAFKLAVLRDFNLSKNLYLTARLGTTYNFLNRAKGRTINQDFEILDYDFENAIYRKNNWGVNGGFSLSYQIGKIRINGNIWMEKSLNYSIEPIDEIRPVFYKIGLGISKKF